MLMVHMSYDPTAYEILLRSWVIKLSDTILLILEILLLVVFLTLGVIFMPFSFANVSCRQTSLSATTPPPEELARFASGVEVSPTRRQQS